MSTYTPTNTALRAAYSPPLGAYTPTNVALRATLQPPSGVGPTFLYMGAVQPGGLWIGAVQPTGAAPAAAAAQLLTSMGCGN